MSLMSMRRKMASKRTAQYIVWAIIIVFVAGIFLVFGGGKYGQMMGTRVAGDEKMIATVNGEKLSAGEFRDRYLEAMGKAPREQQGLEMTLMMREQVVNQLIAQKIAAQQAKALGVKNAWSWDMKVKRIAEEIGKDQIGQMRDMAREQAKEELKRANDPVPEGQKKEKPRTESEIFNGMLLQSAQGLGASESDITEKRFLQLFVAKVISKGEEGMYDVLSDYSMNYLIGEKLAKDLPVSPFSESFVEKLYTKEAKASWIFIAATENSKKGLQEAQKKAKGLRDEIAKDISVFPEKARESNDFMSAFQGGSLGSIKPGINSQTQPIAEYMAMAYEPGTLTPLMAVSVSSPWGGEPQVGYAFLLTQEVLARDKEEMKGFTWANEKEKLLLRAKLRYAVALGQNYLAVQKLEASINYASTELKYYHARANSKLEDAQKLERTLMADQTLPAEVSNAFKYRVATTQYADDLQKRAELFSQIKSGGGKEEMPKMYFDIGSAHVEKGENEKALKAFEMVVALSEDNTDPKMHRDLKAQYIKLKDAAMVKKMDEWLKAHPADANPGAGGFPMNFGQ